MIRQRRRKTEAAMKIQLLMQRRLVRRPEIDQVLRPAAFRLPEELIDQSEETEARGRGKHPCLSVKNRTAQLVELAGDHGVLDEKLKGNNLEGVLVGGFQDDGAGCTSLLNLKPARSTEAPAVTGFEACEAVLRYGSAEVVAKGF
jgi:hypothetical protein